MAKIKLRTKVKGDVVEVKALLDHPMETGRRKNKGELVPAHYITEVTVEANGKVVMSCDMGGSVSKNPYISFKYKGAKGDKIKLSWVDNKGEEATAEAEVGKKKKKK